MDGGAEDDRLYGGPANDVLAGGSQIDTCYGGGDGIRATAGHPGPS